MKEFSTLMFHRFFFYLYFELHIALRCVLGLEEMSVNLIENILAENQCRPCVEINDLLVCLYFIYFYFFYHKYIFHRRLFHTTIFFLLLFHVINIIDDQQLTTGSDKP